MFQSIDAALLHWVAATPDTPTLFVWFGIFSAKVLLYIIPAHLVIMWFAGSIFDRRAALTIFIVVVIAVFIGFLISIGFYRDRPFVEGLVQALIYHKSNASFPSNHATICAAYFTVLYMLRYKTAAKMALVLTLLVCWGRIFVGVHYPFDIFAGLILGGFCAFFGVRAVMPAIPEVVLHIPPVKKG